MTRNTRLVSIKGCPMVIFEAPECISDDIVKHNNFFEFKIFEKWKHHFPEEGFMLDIGANIGSHCVQFNHHFPNIEIHAFEPYLENYQLLLQNTKQYKNTKCFNVGVGSRDSVVSFTDGHYNNSVVVQITPNSDNHNIVLALDNLLFLKPIKFIKIDIEGHELSAFEGMKNLLITHKPTIWAEDHSGKAIPFLEELGYQIIDNEPITKDYLMCHPDNVWYK